MESMPNRQISAAERVAIFREQYGNDIDAGMTLATIVAAAGDYLTTIIGESDVDPGMARMVANLVSASGRQITAPGNWREDLNSASSYAFSEWPLGGCLHDLAAYALYGIVLNDSDDPDVLAEAIQKSLSKAEKFVNATPSAQWEIGPGSDLHRLVRLAGNRWALDNGKPVEPAALAEFGGVSEGRIRNMMAGAKRTFSSGNGRIPGQEALAWLADRREFWNSIWREQHLPRYGVQGHPLESPVFVPVSRDGSAFHPGLQRGGKYPIGEKGSEIQIDGFGEALAALQRMSTPYWRRPNLAGNWGIVAGVRWVRLDSSDLETVARNPNHKISGRRTRLKTRGPHFLKTGRENMKLTHRLTRHAHERSTSRCIPPMIAEIIIEYGQSKDAGEDARTYVLTRESMRKLRQHAGRDLTNAIELVPEAQCVCRRRPRLHHHGRLRIQTPVPLRETSTMLPPGLFSPFAPLLRTIADADLQAEIANPQRLLIEGGGEQGRALEVAYAPFDHVNLRAQVVIVGLTPGRQQMGNALMAARRSLLQGHSEARAAEDAKVFASFSGSMRSNLVAMLDSVGLNKHLGLTSTGSLWAADAHRVHFTSILRYPVFANGANYSGTPRPLKNLLLRKQLTQWFAAEMRALPNAIFVPLGPVVAEAVEYIAEQVGLHGGQVLSGMPHPSGANGERIAFFLGRKRREDLSSKVDPAKVLAARLALIDKVAALRET